MTQLRTASALAFVVAATALSGCAAQKDDASNEFQEALPEQGRLRRPDVVSFPVPFRGSETASFCRPGTRPETSCFQEEKPDG